LLFVSNRARVSAYLAAALLLGVALVFAIAKPWTGIGAPREGSSLTLYPDHTVGFLLPPGVVATYGFDAVTLADGTASVRLTGVRLVDAEGMQLVGVRLLGPDRKQYSWTNASGFPSARGAGSVPAVGAVLTPGPRGWQLLLGLRGTTTGYMVAHGIRIEYEANGKRLTQTIPATLALCGSKTLLRGGVCHPPASILEQS
jgi:hypothetical protein